MNELTVSELDADKFVWTEKFRPRSVKDIVLPAHVRKELDSIIASGEPQNMTLVGPQGTGKTTIARAICNDLDAEYMFINSSRDGGIDTLRGRIQQFGSSASFWEGKCQTKVVILDEGDGLNANSTQPALRGAIEELSGGCRFIITANYQDKILAPILSRSPVISIRPTAADREPMIEAFLDRAIQILIAEGIKPENIDPESLYKLITKCFPDFRKILMVLQRYSSNGGKIDEGINQLTNEIQVKPLIAAMKAKDIAAMRSWIVNNLDGDPTEVFHSLYESLYPQLDKSSVADVIVLLGDYSYKAQNANDRELFLLSACVHVTMKSKFKEG